jgi:hypothetical protein
MFVAFSQFRFSTDERCETRQGGPFRRLLEQKNLQLNFSQRTHPIHPVLPKSHVCCVFGVLVVDGTTSQNSYGRAVLATFGTKNLQLNCSQRMHPIQPFSPNTHVCCVFGVPVFEGTTSRNSPGRSVLATFGTKKLAVELFTTNTPNPPLLTQNSCLLRFRSFCFRRMNDAKLAREVRFGDFWNKKTCS